MGQLLQSAPAIITSVRTQRDLFRFFLGRIWDFFSLPVLIFTLYCDV